MVIVLCVGRLGAEPTASALNLRPSPAIAPGVAAFPRLVAAPGDRAADRINQALGRADERVRRAAKDCRTQDGQKTDWTRTISVTMRGPHFLSLVAADSWFCGGAYPDSDQFPLVYDLTSSAPVNWSRLFPTALVRKTGTETAGDGTVVGTVSSPELHGLYLKGHNSSSECAEALADPSLAFTLWPSARTAGITIQPFGLPHAVTACASDWTIPLSVLRKLNVRHELLDAIAEAHGQGLYDSQK